MKAATLWAKECDTLYCSPRTPHQPFPLKPPRTSCHLQHFYPPTVPTTMVSDDYLAPTTGGSLRLKGAKDAGITKKKKKKKPPPPKPSISPVPGQQAGSDSLGAGTGDAASDKVEDGATENTATAPERGVNPLQEEGSERAGEGEESTHVYKTEAERRHEEMRRKRVRFRSPPLLLLLRRVSLFVGCGFM